ncbi:1-(5-phosphoribosyl)-5-[(5-phosphoribosylamino)methylideneamino] imidazole-4-carboxamide isomerase [Marinicauda algicola]|uniref:1-(5-phosphoribosyl)-5-[(5-phosphoribosylamino)methylideneamino] imidazole-4-carboxamide isomerase n=1 Tax=Marinicauda algicola TaxID=2029849 RepID=A0A4S2GXH9_9PROT|nr:1-(5-phosphoribosyl)-5-[(5-phosphoribosylamino)methylideneamino] imidazole-4-carboxamide isomerase [Marinicauda algicola]TGY87835.1 1-(5-phosphoribosyl)-5-[(5-phosphoribosylamino)methylideneamino] imidazole-4-carboxamide isomerase [Marinicauda algicola]
MILYPAIDVLDGRVVRLEKGDFNAVTDYGGDPVAVAQGYLDAGADWLHMVDLSGARDGARRQGALVEKIARTGIRVQTGGGVRSEADVAQILDAGAERAVVGSVAVTSPQTVIGWLNHFGADRITAAFDVRIVDGTPYPAVKGWTETTPTPLGSVLEAYRRAELTHALVTDVGRDGMLEGPNTDLYRDLATARPDLRWQASGGVSSLDDLKRLKAAGAAGAVIGKALFEGRFTLQEALSC